MDGFNQNAAESYNGLLWHFCPKETFVGSRPLNIAAALATLIYNDGYCSLELLFEHLGVSIGNSCRKILLCKDREKIYHSQRKVDAKEKNIRQAKRRRRLEEEDKNKEQEGIIYEYGGF